MPFVVRRRVVSPILATTQEGRFFIIPGGPIIETSDHLDQPGLHSITLGGEELFAFTRDIEQRSERIDSSAASEEVVVRENFAGRS